MSGRACLIGTAYAALLLTSCEEVTTQSERTTLSAAISVEGSPFVANGLNLVGDQVRFTARVTDSEGSEIAIDDLTFSSDNPDVVRILDASTGDAEFTGVGQTSVSVVIAEPTLDPTTEKLGANMQISVSEFEVDLSLNSTVTSSGVDPQNAIVKDTVQVVPSVTLDGSSVESQVRSITSDDPSVADPAAASGADRVALADSGEATLTIRLEEPDIPGEEPLTVTLAVTVKNLLVEFQVTSLVPGSSHLAAGDTLVTDSVRFSATVRRGGEMVQTSGALWTSSDPLVVEIVNPGDVGTFVGEGSATVSVDFADPKLPGAPFELQVPVSTFAVELDLESVISGSSVLADPLLTDTVRVLETVTLNDAPRASSIQRIETSDISRIAPIGRDSAVLVGTGSAALNVTLAEPTLPRDSVRAQLPLEIATYLAQISPQQPSPIMGDQIDYNVTVTYTRDDSEVSNPDVAFSSTNPNVILINNAATGAALARDTGSARVVVVSNNPTLPAGTVSDTTALTTITEERFYGAFSKTSGSFGESRGDSVIIENSVEHSFTPSSRVEFDNGIPAFIERVQVDTLIFLVPAGGASGPLTLRNLIDQEGDPRDGVITRFDFDVTNPGPDDLFEPNDAFPLADTDTVNLTNRLPFEALLAIDPAKTGVAQDTNFFWLRNPNAEDLIVDIRAETQQNADIDFFVCFGTGGTSADPPTGYDPGACARVRGLNTAGQVEEQLNEVLQQGRHVFGFYCAGFQGGPCPPAVPVSYKVTIEPS